MKLHTASGPVLWFMDLCHFDGWTSLWNTVYLRPGHEANTHLIRHEQEHLNQMARDGKVWFMLKYTWWLLRYGYRNNTYEIAARKAADQHRGERG